ncbi:WAP domain-containing protein [Durusdinium trenchii]
MCQTARDTCSCRVKSNLAADGDVLEGLRLFVEHVAGRLFLFAGASIYAFDLHSLEELYVLIVPTDEALDETRCGDQEILARWDYGLAFLAHQAEGREVAVWSTQDGAHRGHIRSGCELLCCDISHNSSSAIVATLETDGEIRLFTSQASDGTQATWECSISVSVESLEESPIQPIVEVKLEQSVLLAVTHSEDGATGVIHVWEILSQLHLLQNHYFLFCDRPPDRVEARHGGQFIEVFFLTDSLNPRPPDGIYNIKWFSPKLELLFNLDRCVGDWRCDLRDVAARLEDDRTISWAPLWRPICLTTACS